MKILMISDAGALGLMEARPEPAWRVGMSVLRNKELLAPDYGAMHVAAALEAAGFQPKVINLVADTVTDAGAFREPNAGPGELSGAGIAGAGSAESTRAYLLEALERERADVVFLGLSVYNLALHTRRLMGDVKEACGGATLLTGGIYATFHAAELLADGHVDAVIRGEGEVAAVEVLRCLEKGEDLEGVDGLSFRRGGGAVHNPARALNTDLDRLPHPYNVGEEFKVAKRFSILSELLPETDWIAGSGFLTSRGCPEGCSFCLDPAINRRRTRFHSPAYVRDVLEFCSREYAGGAGGFFFGDATFTMNRKRLARILDFLPEFPYSYHIQTRADYLERDTIERLAAAGVTNVAIGAETFNERVLREVVNKRLLPGDVLEAARAVRAAGMKPMLTFIVGLPNETRESVMRTVEILRENELFDATFFPLVVFKGTGLFDEFVATHSLEDAERARVSPVSEEFLYTSDEFPTGEELKEFTDQVNFGVKHRSLLF
jgi:anaerobic magnesium-protoporphyrin IX monomethyl ester cyclase